MSLSEKENLIEFSKAIRDSTIKRLKIVPTGYENWSISENAMSFADTVHHLIECDNWLFKKLKNRELKPILGQNKKQKDIDRKTFDDLILDLIKSGEKRVNLIKNLSNSELQEKIFDQRFGEVTVWWVIVRGNLDHEIHHRGQLAIYLRILKDRNILK